jgi:hypothetical protein
LETLIILLVAAGLSAAVVWWAMSPPVIRDQRRDPRARRPDRTTSPRPAPEDTGDGFVLMPDASPILDDDRPPAILSLLRLAVAIAVVSAIVVAAIALIGLLVKLQLDQYFRTGA